MKIEFFIVLNYNEFVYNVITEVLSATTNTIGVLVTIFWNIKIDETEENFCIDKSNKFYLFIYFEFLS